jgi:hypothetical protein
MSPPETATQCAAHRVAHAWANQQSQHQRQNKKGDPLHGRYPWKHENSVSSVPMNLFASSRNG